MEIGSAEISQIHKNFGVSISLEELCRKKRQEFFQNVLEKYHSNAIILAHHLDDRIETFIFNLARGSKISGLINMTEKSGNILRPLLGVTKNEILNYLEKCNYEYKIDSTNFENNFTRNKIRNSILPHFSELNTAYQAHI